MLLTPLGGPAREIAVDRCYEAELLAGAAGALGGGGSVVPGGAPPGPGEELALACEVGKAVKEHRWPPLNPYPPPTSLS